jgi:hypothetical protein
MSTHPDAPEHPFEAVRRANAIPAAPLTAAVDGALADLALAIVSQPYPSCERLSKRTAFRLRPRVALVAGVLALAVGGVATAAVALRAHTGIFPSGPNATAGGPGEELNLAAPDFSNVALTLSADIPYPSGYGAWRDFVVTEQLLGPGGVGPTDQISTGAVRGTFAASAYCAWVQDWRQAMVAGDSGEAQQAEVAIAAAPGWSAVTAEDPHPSPTAANDAGAETGTLFGWMLPYGTAVLAGDRVAVDQLLATGYGDGKCWLSDPTWMAEWRAQGQAWHTSDQIAEHYRQFLAQERP